MMKENICKLLAVIGVIVLLAGYVYASGAIATAVKGLWKGIKLGPYLIGEAIAEVCKMAAKTWVVLTAYRGVTFLEGIFDNIDSLLTTNPPVGEIFTGMWFFMRIIAPFYILAILILAIYLLIGSSSPRSRAKAKSVLSKVIVGVVLISISPAFLKILFLIAESLTRALMPVGA
ncbi:MAG: hypothetical protein KAU03_06670, partial [Candidatus Altiarchaeales archaeon]|nr:hypothetical protein [Candidatus Altiarchaeales archaeon]